MSESKEESQGQAETARRSFNWRGFFSLLLFGSFTLLLFTGAILYATPKGRVAHWTGWTALGLEKEEWGAIHMTSALAVILAAGFHLNYNWSIFWGYIKHKGQGTLYLKRELALAILLCAIIILGTIYDVPPFATIDQWNEDIKLYWEARSAAGPIPHAEELSIAQLAEEIDMPLDLVIQRLKKAGVTVGDASVSVNDPAIAHGMTPSGLSAIVKPESGRGTGNGRPGAGGGQGVGDGNRGIDAASGGAIRYGRMTVRQCCETANLEVEIGLARLKEAGIETSTSESIREISQGSGKKPSEIVEIV